MNLGRGFFRIWVLLSVIWFTHSFVSYEPHVQLQTYLENSKKLPLFQSVVDDELSTDPNVVSQQAPLFEEKQQDPERFLLRTLQMQVKVDLARQHLEEFALYTLIPIVSLFCIGWLLLWTIRGFSRND